MLLNKFQRLFLAYDIEIHRAYKTTPTKEVVVCSNKVTSVMIAFHC